jgi:hypothetical protein
MVNRIADDFMLGQLIARTRRPGADLADREVMVHEDFACLARRELRWPRTIRATEPVAHWWSVVTQTLSLVALSLSLSWPLRTAKSGSGACKVAALYKAGSALPRDRRYPFI